MSSVSPRKNSMSSLGAQCMRPPRRRNRVRANSTRAVAKKTEIWMATTSSPGQWPMMRTKYATSGMPPASTARSIGGRLRMRPPMAYRTSTAASPPNRVSTVLFMRFFRTVETDGFAAGFRRVAKRRNDQFEMTGVLCQFGGQVHAGLDQPAVAGLDRDLAEVSQIERTRRNAARTDHIGLILCRLVGDVDLVAIADVAIRQHDIQRLANLVDDAVVAATRADAVDEISAHQDQGHAIADGFQALPFHSGLVRRRRGQILFRVVADQATRKIERIHDGVARIDAQAARNAFVLKAVADVDAGRAHLHAQPAVDAIAHALLVALGERALAGACAGTAVRPLATLRVVMHRQRFRLVHDALEAAIRADVGAYLLAHQSGGGVGGDGQHADGDIGGGGCLAGDEVHHQLRRIGKVSDERDAGPERGQQPQDMRATD